MDANELIALLRRLNYEEGNYTVRVATDLGVSEHVEIEVVKESDAYGPHILIKPDVKPEVRQPAKPNQLADFNIFGFNTLRAYTEQGQRISVGYKLDMTEESEVLVLFYDHSRGIFGRLKTEGFGGAKDLFLNGNDMRRARAVMGMYDKHQYHYHPQADKLDAQDWPTIAL
jgi:hypothetical protein